MLLIYTVNMWTPLYTTNTNNIVHRGVKHILCCVFVLFVFVLCLCCQFLLIVHFWLSLRYSLTFIYQTFLSCISISDRSTGVVTTARLTHATPAAAYAHSPTRKWESDRQLIRRMHYFPLIFFMAYIPECKQQVRTHRYEILHTWYLGCNNLAPRCDYRWLHVTHHLYLFAIYFYVKTIFPVDFYIT
jgi:hypothetical protein